MIGWQSRHFDSFDVLLGASQSHNIIDGQTDYRGTSVKPNKLGAFSARVNGESLDQ